jgi:hypothetical protein
MKETFVKRLAVFSIHFCLHNLTYGEECEFQQESHGYNSPHIHVLIYTLSYVDG